MKVGVTERSCQALGIRTCRDSLRDLVRFLLGLNGVSKWVSGQNKDPGESTAVDSGY